MGRLARIGVFLSTLSLAMGCGTDAELGELRVELCSEIIDDTQSIEIIISRDEGFGTPLPEGASLEDVDGVGAEELVWLLPEPEGGFEETVYAQVSNVIGTETISARVTTASSGVLSSEPLGLVAGLRIPVCLPGADAGVDGRIDAGEPDDDADPLDPDAGHSDDDIVVTSMGADSPDIVATAAGFAVAWVDARAASSDIYFALLDDAGSIVGSEVPVATGQGNERGPSLVATDAGFGLAWHDEGDNEIYFVRIDSSGLVQGPATRVTNAAGVSSFPSLAFGGGGFGVAWEDTRAGFAQAFYAQLDGSGTKIGGDVLIGAPGEAASQPFLTHAGGTDYAVVWRDQRNMDGGEIYFAKLNADGSKATTDERLTNDPGLSSLPAVVFNGSDFGVAFDDNRNDLGTYFVGVDSDGNKISTEIFVGNVGIIGRSCDLAWTGSEYVVAWTENFDQNQNRIHVVRLNASGAPTGDSVPISNLGNAQEPALIHRNAETAAVWHDDRTGRNEVYFQESVP